MTNKYWSAKRRLRRGKTPAVVIVSVLVFALVIGAGLFIGLDQRSAEKSFARALQYREQGEIAASIIELKSALQKDPENIEARISLGQIYLDISDLLSAAKELQRARTFGAELSRITEPLSRTWLLQRNYQKVLDELSLEGLDPGTRAIVLVAHARAYAGFDQPDKAQDAISAALEADPLNTAAWIERARLSIRANDFVTAQEALVRLAELAPDNVEATALRGDLNLRSGNFADAVVEYKKVIARDPGHLPTKVALANAFLAQGIVDEADRVLEAALAQVPTSADANYAFPRSSRRVSPR